MYKRQPTNNEITTITTIGTAHLMTVPDAPHLRILQAIDYLPLNMVTIPSLGRTVTSRERFARIFAIGDRSNPSAYTPSMVLIDDEDSLEVADAPFRMLRDSSKAPAELRMKTRANLCPPFDDPVVWEASEGLSLPPSLIESDAGIFPLSLIHI